MDCILFGSGGHAKVVIDILQAMGTRVIGFMDDYREEDHWRGIPNLGNLKQANEIILNYPQANFLVAIGDNEIRQHIARLLERSGAKFHTAVHPSASIGSDVTIGAGSVLMPGTIVNADSRIGEHCIVNTGGTVDHDCSLGNFVHLSPGVHLAGNVEIDDLSHIGTGASAIPGIRIGSRTIVGAGAVVIRSLPNRVTAVGCPAKIIDINNMNEE
ncbi:acetyltransferase [Saccharibacillus sp. O23]|uniref:acetyltransferase n=1 Tax=Saccharibacillus sp. O23 TaxID=2009338 RepID=UPI000B4E53EA|nr:acetyltransferase [Saccharibacillus sp. O23]OWR27590.1 acetyltransferase [Saccharibacillus sp. O23]